MRRERAAVVGAEPALAAGNAFACAGSSFVVESLENKGVLLMVVFKQAHLAQTFHPASKTNERSRVGKDARHREHQHERE